jgi:hypothetical protein
MKGDRLKRRHRGDSIERPGKKAVFRVHRLSLWYDSIFGDSGDGREHSRWTVSGADLANEGKHEFVEMRWGLVPFWWSKSLKELRVATFNARVAIPP